MSIEKEIERGIINFTRENGIMISKDMIDQFIKKTYYRRRLSLPQELYLYLCKYLFPTEIVIFTTICKEYMTYYQYIWDIIQSYYHPKSIIPNNDYLAIRQNIAINNWYSKINELNIKEYVHWARMETYEKIIQKKSQEISLLVPSYIDYKWKKSLYQLEIHTNKENRERSFYNCEKYHWLIEYYKFFSERDFNGNLYYIIKPELDMRLYGLNPENKKDEQKWKVGLKWITGVYNNTREYYDVETDNAETDNAETDDDELYYYNNYFYDHDYEDDRSYRYRVRPDWC